MGNLEVAILMGSDSDYPIMKKAEEILNEFGIEYKTRVLSAHRTPNQTEEFVKESEKNGVKVFIAGAGGAAHLAGVVAAYTARPVIGVPIMGKAMNGLDSLLSMVQMPPGVPVATVAVDGAKNAALLAIQILATGDKALFQKMWDYKSNMEKEVLEKDRNLLRNK